MQPSDPTIAQKFNTYRFADHKEKVIDLLKRVTRVSVGSMAVEWQWKEPSDNEQEREHGPVTSSYF